MPDDTCRFCGLTLPTHGMGCLEVIWTGYLPHPPPIEEHSVFKDVVDSPSKIGTRLGGPNDDHYAILTIQPRDAVRAWSLFWPKQVIHQLGEAIYSIARCGTKNQLLRDLKKAKWCLEDAIQWLEDNPSSR